MFGFFLSWTFLFTTRHGFIIVFGSTLSLSFNSFLLGPFMPFTSGLFHILRVSLLSFQLQKRFRHVALHSPFSVQLILHLLHISINFIFWLRRWFWLKRKERNQNKKQQNKNKSRHLNFFPEVISALKSQMSQRSTSCELLENSFKDLSVLLRISRRCSVFINLWIYYY